MEGLSILGHAGRSGTDAALVINPACFSSGCVRVLDALKLIRKPLFQVHLANIHQCRPRASSKRADWHRRRAGLRRLQVSVVADREASQVPRCT